MEACVRMIDLPVTVQGFTAVDEDGFFSIYINSRLSKCEQEKALMHEYNHILANDVYNNIPIEDAESNAELFILPERDS